MSTQTRTIKSHLEMHGKISSWDAIQSYKITRLAAVIHLLRESGMHIESVKKKNVGGKNWVEYRYHHENADGQFNLL